MPLYSPLWGTVLGHIHNCLGDCKHNTMICEGEEILFAICYNYFCNSWHLPWVFNKVHSATTFIFSFSSLLSASIIFWLAIRAHFCVFDVSVVSIVISYLPPICYICHIGCLTCFFLSMPQCDLQLSPLLFLRGSCCNLFSVLLYGESFPLPGFLELMLIIIDKISTLYHIVLDYSSLCSTLVDFCSTQRPSRLQIKLQHFMHACLNFLFTTVGVFLLSPPHSYGTQWTLAYVTIIHINTQNGGYIKYT